VALVIGNGAYEHAPRLPNPVHDATDIAAELGALGYSVQLVKDARKTGMEAALTQFARVAKGADQALIYYSGHGIEVAGVNYLLPVEARVESETTVPLEAVSLATVIDVAAGARQLGLVVLDACRNNPLANSMQRADGSRGVARGLAPVEPTGNLLVAFATRDGRVAADGTGRNSPYTTAILETLREPGVEVSLFWRSVRDRVLKATNAQQEPFTYGSLGAERVYLNPPASSPSPASVYDPRAAELALWQGAQSLGTQDAYRDYLAKYPQGQFSTQAKLQLAALGRPAAGGTGLVSPSTGTIGTTTSMHSGSVAGPGNPQRASLAAMAPGTVFQDCEGCPEMVRVPTGSFSMGSPDEEVGRNWSEGPVHTVTIRYPLAVSKYPVTRGQWREYLQKTGKDDTNNCAYWNPGPGYVQKPEYSWRNPGFQQDDTHPVVCIKWQEAHDYAAWLSSQTGHNYRLLSEAEYEFVNRAGRSGNYSWGNNPDDACSYANVLDTSGSQGNFAIAHCDDGYVFTSPVGHFKPNAFGLYDTTGNVWSWTADCWHDSYRSAPTDGRTWGDWNAASCGGARVRRGGSWGTFFSGPGVRAALRNWTSASIPLNDTGFRIAMADPREHTVNKITGPGQRIRKGASKPRT